MQVSHRDVALELREPRLELAQRFLRRGQPLFGGVELEDELPQHLPLRLNELHHVVVGHLVARRRTEVGECWTEVGQRGGR